ncbi:hypothetical protein ACX1NX_12820 [Acinetobacter sp. ANC 5383]
MTQIFALQGTSNSGKTSTLIQLDQEIQNKYPNALRTIHIHRKDICISYEIIVNGSVIKVGIESQGDPNSRLKDSLELFKNIGCDIIFCACRTQGMTVDWINDFAQRNHYNQPIFITKQKNLSLTQSQDNLSAAQNLMRRANL